MSEPFGWCPNDHKTPAQQFADEALENVRRLSEHVHQRQEAAMKDTEMPLTHIPDVTTYEGTSIAVFPAGRVLTDAESIAVILREDNAVLIARIEELEGEIDEIRGTATPLLEQLERMAATLKTFYYAELSMSTLQPILALCIELNPEIMEKRR
jgi:hypothetical protein